MKPLQCPECGEIVLRDRATLKTKIVRNDIKCPECKTVLITLKEIKEQRAHEKRCKDIPQMPPCFDERHMWEGWYIDARVNCSQPITLKGTKFCEDCDEEYQAQMIKEKRCLHPKFKDFDYLKPEEEECSAK